MEARFYNITKSGHIGDVKRIINTEHPAINVLNRGLYGACKGGHLDVVKCLLNAGANNFKLALWRAVEGQHAEIIEYLISYHNYDVDYRDINVWNKALSRAIQNDNDELINLFINKKITDINDAVCAAIRKGNYKLFKLLIKKYISKNKTKYSKWLVEAIMVENIKVIHYLINKDAPITKDVIRAAAKIGNMDIITLFVDKYDMSWNVGLDEALHNQHIDVALFMIEQGVDAKAINQCYINCCYDGYIEGAKMMMTYGANSFNDGLYGACISRTPELIKLAAENGANEYTQAFRLIDNHHKAIYQEKCQLIDCLLKCFPDLYKFIFNQKIYRTLYGKTLSLFNEQFRGAIDHSSIRKIIPYHDAYIIAGYCL